MTWRTPALTKASQNRSLLQDDTKTSCGLAESAAAAAAAAEAEGAEEAKETEIGAHATEGVVIAMEEEVDEAKVDVGGGVADLLPAENSEWRRSQDRAWAWPSSISNKRCGTPPMVVPCPEKWRISLRQGEGNETKKGKRAHVLVDSVRGLL